MGSRMGTYTKESPKCMTRITDTETILSRQLKQIETNGIKEVVITTGYFDSVLKNYCIHLPFKLNYTFVNNPVYDKTNYIYSIYLARNVLESDLIFMHGDLVFEDSVLQEVLKSDVSCMTVSSTLDLPEKDFKAMMHNSVIQKVGIEYFEQALAAQPLYKLLKGDWQCWLEQIICFCQNGKTSCYAENALNEVSDQCEILGIDIKNRLCGEIDNEQDLKRIQKQLEEKE